MCIKDRMRNNTKKNANQGFLGQLASAVGLSTPANATASTPATNTSVKVSVSENSTTKLQQGGMAPVNFRYPANMQQPSERVMQWATTADAPTPPASEMRNVAHGGKRRTHRKHKTAHRRRSLRKTRSCGGKRRKTHRRHRHHKRRN